MEDDPLFRRTRQHAEKRLVFSGAISDKQRLKDINIHPEIIDVRILNPLYVEDIVKSVKKTRKLLVVDPGWTSSGFSAELVTKIVEKLSINCLTSPPVRIALPDAPAPTAKILEDVYYTSIEDIVIKVKKLF